MLSQNNIDGKEVVIKSTLILLAVSIHTLEYFLPRIPLFPWLKPGFANAVTIIWIIRYGVIDSIVFTLIRIWLPGFFFGFSFLSITLSLSGGLFSCLTMSFAWHTAGRNKFLGITGISIIGALFHNTGQLLTIFMLMAQNYFIFYQIPVMCVLSVIFGTLTALFAFKLDKIIISTRASDIFYHRIPVRSFSLPAFKITIAVFLLLFCMGLSFTDHLYFLLSSLVIINLFVIIITKWSIKQLFMPFKRFWMIFLFIGILHSFFTYGRYIDFLPGITEEGLYNTMIQWIKIWIWLQTSRILGILNFDKMMINVIKQLFPSHETTLYSGLLSLEAFPDTIESTKRNARRLLPMLFKNPAGCLKDILKIISDSIGIDKNAI